MNALEHRRSLKARKPKFIKQDSHKKPGIAQKWSRPRGIDSKMRLKLKGYRRMVSVGWKSPQEARCLDRSGLRSIVVHNKAEAEKLDAKTDGLIISSTVGMKKKIELIKIAKQLGMRILNVKDPDKYVSDAENRFESRKKEKKEKKEIEERKQQAKKKEEKKQERLEKEKQEKKEETKTVDEIAKEEEQRQEQEKKEQEKILTKRE